MALSILRPARGDSLRRRHLRLSALLSAGLSLPGGTAEDRAARRADKIRARLGWEPGILNGRGWKPKRMRWGTFERLTAEHDAFVNESLAAVARRLGIRMEEWLG